MLVCRVLCNAWGGTVICFLIWSRIHLWFRPAFMKKHIITTVSAWLVFIGIDFFFHASLLKPLWEEPVAAIKPLEELACLIPAGYGSFLLLTALVGYLFSHIYGEKPPGREALRFGLIFGLLFSVANALGLYSYVAIPVKQLVAFNLVYLVEILAVTGVFYRAAGMQNGWRILRFGFLIFLGFVLAGIAVQALRPEAVG